MSKFTDVTDMTDAAFEVFLSVKSGDDCVDAGHLSAAERLSVAEALAGSKPLTAREISRVVGPSRTAARSLHVSGDVEGLILAEQESAEGFNH